MAKKSFFMIIMSVIVLWSFNTLGHKGLAAEITQLQSFQNPPYQEINRMLTESALEVNIPPEIVKAVAFKESSWLQFVDGAPNVTADGGIGIMQVTNDLRFDQERLKMDIEYNIKKGVQILDEKFQDGQIPILNDHNRDVLESWYFAVLAYNGKVQENSPIKRDDGSLNTGAYQEEVYLEMNSQNNLMGVNPLLFQFRTEDFTYSGEPHYLLSFNKSKYEVPNSLLNVTKHKFEKDDVVLSATGANFRSAPSQLSARIRTAPSEEREAVTIREPFVYDESYKYNEAIDMRYKQYVWYKVMLQDGKTTYTASGELKPLGKRLHGHDRYETATAVSREGWESGADTVVIANANNFPDALAGTPLAYQLDAPLLLSHANTLRDATKKEIQRLGAKNAVLLGSSGVISTAVEKELNDLGIKNITRYGGSDRFETAVEIANQLLKKDTAILAYGYDFPDALAIAPYAAIKGYPIFLTRTGNLPDATAKALKNYENTIVVGGVGIIHPALFQYVNHPIRFGGKTRFETNANIVDGLEHGNDMAYVATGLDFPDALTGAVLAAKHDAPILLTWPRTVHEPIRNTIQKQKIDYFSFLGSDTVVGVQNEIGKIIEGINY